MLDRRKFPRIDERWEISYKKIDTEDFKNNPVMSLTVNISGGGICFESEEEIPIGTIIALELNSDDFPTSIIALAKSIWCKKKIISSKYDVGAEFWWIGWKDNDAQEALAEYIRKRTQE